MSEVYAWEFRWVVRMPAHGLPPQEERFFRQLGTWLAPPVVVDLDVEGSEVRSGWLVLGAKAGPARSVWNIAHEMAHLIEVEPARLLRRGWGLTQPQMEINGQRVFVPQTAQATRREVRVMGIQARIMTHLGLPFDFAQAAKFLEHLPDADRLSPAGRECLPREIRAISEATCIDQIRSRWKWKLALLERLLSPRIGS